MSYMLTSLLSNMFFILFPIMMYQIFWGDRQLHKLHGLIHKLMGCFAIGLCILYPTELMSGYSFDLHLTPFIIASLYGGHHISLLLAGFMLMLDIFLFTIRRRTACS